MAIIAKASESNFKKLELPEDGTHQAVCCGVWDIGIQEFVWNNETKRLHKVVIAWELDQLIKDEESEYNGKPYMLTNKYTLSLDERSNLYRDLVAWRGKRFTDDEILQGVDLESLYGVNCLLSVIHNETPTGTYANISAIMPLTKGAEKLVPVRGKDEAPPTWVEKLAAQAVEPMPTGAYADDVPDFMKG